MTMAVLGVATWAGAHLTPSSLSLSPAAPFTPGQAVTVKWGVAVSHGTGINVDLSSDGGNTWKTLKTGVSDASGQGSVVVTLPAEPTTQGKIRVCQGSPSACATIKVSQPSTPPYTLISNEFTVSGTSAVAADAAKPFAAGLEAASGKIEGSFELARAGEVTLQAFDPEGRLLATLLQDRFPAGTHRISVAAPRALASAPALVFRLKSGESVRTSAWTRP
jgi:hypothetical protein